MASLVRQEYASVPLVAPLQEFDGEDQDEAFACRTDGDDVAGTGDVRQATRRKYFRVVAPVVLLAAGLLICASRLRSGGHGLPDAFAKATVSSTRRGFLGAFAVNKTIPIKHCLCVFDVDRTLTAKQGTNDTLCRDTETMDGVFDPAFLSGTLRLSQLGQRLSHTFCQRCYRGVATAGNAGGQGSKEQSEITRVLGGISATLSDSWSSSVDVRSPLVMGAVDGQKQHTVRDIVNWYRSVGVHIPDHRVWFFDDRTGNAAAFRGTGFNARQVACSKRDGIVGYCGARTAEIVKARGVKDCPASTGPDHIQLEQ